MQRATAPRGTTGPHAREGGRTSAGARTPRSGSPAHSRSGRDVAASVALVAVTFLAYLPALRGGFVWDDDDYVTNNMALRSLEGLADIWTSNLEAVGRVLAHGLEGKDLAIEGRRLGRSETSQYYPATYTTFWIEYQLWRVEPFGYHLVNVLLHATAAVLLWMVLRRLAVPGAWLAAAVFALHPVHVESVAWVTERKNVLSAVFYLLSLLAYLRFARLERPAEPGRRASAAYAASLVLFGLALLSKTAVVALPAVILLLLWWKRDRLYLRDVVPVLPMFAMAAGMGAVTILVERYNVGAASEDPSLSIAGRCLLAGRILWFYLHKLVWPIQLTFIYPRWSVDPSVWGWHLFPLAAVGVVVALWALRWRIGKAPLVAALYFGGSLAPVLGFIGVFFMRYSYVADHFQYLASIGPIALLSALAATGLKLEAPTPGSEVHPPADVLRLGRRWLAPSACLVVLAGLTWNQCRAYESAETLWRDTLRKNPAAWIAHNNLANILIGQGKLDEAMEHFRMALSYSPDYPEAHTGLGIILAQQGKLDDAIRHFQERLRLKSGSPMAHTNLALALARTGAAAEAHDHFNRALAMDPDYLDARRGLAVLLARQGRYEDALVHFQHVARLVPDDAEAQFDLAGMLHRVGRVDDARAAYRRTLAIDPDHARARQALNNLQSAPRPP